MKAAVLLFLAAACAAQAAVPDLWPVEVKAPQPAELKKQCAALDAAPLPAELKPAAQFQKTFLKILSGGESKAQPLEPDWVEELRAFIAADRAEDPVAHGVAEISRAWLARAQMRKIDAALRLYYRQNVRFPERFSEIAAGLPEALRLDPWGQPWAYRPDAPKGLEKLAGQRYLLGPGKAPALGTLAEAIGHPRAADPAFFKNYQITPRQLTNKRALEFRDSGPPPIVSTLEAGGFLTERIRLLHIGNHWALFAWPDQLFAVPF